MSCQMMVSLGVYVLGAADPAERRRIEAHLPCCGSCRAELLRLSPVPGLLASVPPGLVTSLGQAAAARAGAPVSTATAAARSRAAWSAGAAAGPHAPGRRPPGVRWRALPAAAAACAAAVLLVMALAVARIGGPGPGSPGPGSPGSGGQGPAGQGARPGTAAAVTLAGANPATHVRATAALIATSWGTRITLRIRGVPQNVRCSLVVRSTSGATEISGTWTAWRAGPVSVPASADWRPADIASLQVRAGSRTLLTMQARTLPPRPPAARAVPRQAP